MNQVSQYILNLYHYLLNLRDTLEYTLEREHTVQTFENRKQVLIKGLDPKAALGNFFENNKENSEKVRENIQSIISEFYEGGSNVLTVTQDGKVRVDHTQHIKIYDMVIGTAESVRDILYGYIAHAKRENQLEPEVEDLVKLDERLYRRVLVMLVLRDFEKSFAEFQKVMGESGGKPTPQSNFIVQNEILKMAGFIRFSRQHARCTDNETLDLLDEVNAVIEMTEGRRDRRDDKSFQDIFKGINEKVQKAVAEIEVLWKASYQKEMAALMEYQESLRKEKEQAPQA